MNNIQNKSAPSISLIKRFMIIFYDLILLASFLFFPAFISSWAFNITYDSPYYPLFIIFMYSLAFIYFGWCWTRQGQTLSMKTWKSKLISFDGSPVSWKQAAIRFTIALISLPLLGISFWWAIFDKEKLTLHDLISKTKIIKEINKD